MTLSHAHALWVAQNSVVSKRQLLRANKPGIPCSKVFKLLSKQQRRESTMKKLINATEDVVKEALAGMKALHPELLRVDYANQIIVRAHAPVQGKVRAISRRGVSHQPIHGWLVGRVMSHAVCSGAII